MKKVLLDIHIYLSLACAGYLVLYGLSGLFFNHHVQPDEEPGRRWESRVEVPAVDDDQARAEAVRDRLELAGWVPFWRHRHPRDGEHVFFVNRPAREYRVQLDMQTGQVQVRETGRGLIGAINGLHGMKHLPNSLWGASWSLYTELSILALLFSVGSGVWFWWLRPSARRTGWWLLGLGSGGSLLLMVWIVA